MNHNIGGFDKVIIYYRTGVKVLRGLFYRLFLKEAHGLFLVGKHVQISHAKHIRCGKNVTISRGVMIRPSSYYGKDLGYGLEMGDNSSIGPYGYVGCSGKIVIGENVMFGPKCSLFAENHVFEDTNSTIKSQGVSQKGIVVEDDCWIGSNVTILDGVRIGKGSVIGAGTLISKDVPDNSIIMDRRDKVNKERL